MCDTVYTIDDIKTVLQPVFVKHSVKKAVLFGSYVKGLANSHSDVDLLLVDVFDETHIIPNSKIFSEISKDGVVIYEK